MIGTKIQMQEHFLNSWKTYCLGDVPMAALCLGKESLPGERETRKTRSSYNMGKEGRIDTKAG